MTLMRTISNAQDRITGTPQKFDPQMMVHQQQKP